MEYKRTPVIELNSRREVLRLCPRDYGTSLYLSRESRSACSCWGTTINLNISVYFMHKSIVNICIYPLIWYGLIGNKCMAVLRAFCVRYFVIKVHIMFCSLIEVRSGMDDYVQSRKLFCVCFGVVGCKEMRNICNFSSLFMGFFLLVSCPIHYKKYHAGVTLTRARVLKMKTIWSTPVVPPP